MTFVYIYTNKTLFEFVNSLLTSYKPIDNYDIIKKTLNNNEESFVRIKKFFDLIILVNLIKNQIKDKSFFDFKYFDLVNKLQALDKPNCKFINLLKLEVFTGVFTDKTIFNADDYIKNYNPDLNMLYEFIDDETYDKLYDLFDCFIK